MHSDSNLPIRRCIETSSTILMEGALGERLKKLRSISRIRIFGGCCGTDNQYMECTARKLAD